MSETSAPQQTDMVSIEIDGVETKAAKGSMIIEAADDLGIDIPRFCYHKKLSIAANCRMCLVDVEKAPKPLPACATPVMDGMKVYTQSKRARSAQQNVMEFLLINHPLDCPICDQGGECELQDVSMGYGKSASRFTERKRVVKDENLGSLISTEMTRCIHCTRCVRFLDEIAGTNELGGMGRGDRTFISTFIGRSVDSEMSGNIIDLCPVGALTNKPFRYSARAWEMRSNPAVAPHDAVGSNYHLHLKRGRIMRSVPRENERVNENWLPDRDRWGYMGLYSDERATQPQIKVNGQWKDVSWDDAIERTAEILRESQADETGFLLSPQASCEELHLAVKIAHALGIKNVDHRLKERDFSGTQRAPRVDVEITDIHTHDAVFIVGANPRHDQPMIGHQIRQAERNGAKIFALNARDYDWVFNVDAKSIVAPHALSEGIQSVGAGKGEFAQQVKDALQEAKAPLILLGDVAMQDRNAATIRAQAADLAEAVEGKLLEMPQGANALGAWQAGAVPSFDGEPGMHAADMITKQLRNYVIYGFEPMQDTAWGRDAQNALEAADAVVYFGAFVTDEIRAAADVILPLAVIPEVEGALVNLSGHMQISRGETLPPGDARAGWKILRVLGNQLGLEGFEYTRAEHVRAEFAGSQAPEFSGGEKTADKKANVLLETPMYASDGMVRRSGPLQATVHGELAGISISAADAEKLGVSHGTEQVCEVDGTQRNLMVRVDSTLPQGVIRVAMGVPGNEALVSASHISVGEK